MTPPTPTAAQRAATRRRVISATLLLRFSPEQIEWLEDTLIRWDADAYRAGLKAAKDTLPTNWVDPILDSLGDPPWNCPDIERFVKAIADALDRRAGEE